MNIAAKQVLFVDFVKSYDKVSHKNPLCNLRSKDINRQFSKVIRFLYETTVIYVRTKNRFKDNLKYECGVRKKCITSPLIFNLYIFILSSICL